MDANELRELMQRPNVEYEARLRRERFWNTVRGELAARDLVPAHEHHRLEPLPKWWDLPGWFINEMPADVRHAYGVPPLWIPAP